MHTAEEDILLARRSPAAAENRPVRHVSVQLRAAGTVARHVGRSYRHAAGGRPAPLKVKYDEAEISLIFVENKTQNQKKKFSDFFCFKKPKTVSRNGGGGGGVVMPRGWDQFRAPHAYARLPPFLHQQNYIISFVCLMSSLAAYVFCLFGLFLCVQNQN